MSNAFAIANSPLNGARFKGLVMIHEEPPQGMITLRCDLEKSKAKVKKVTGTAMPKPRQVSVGDTSLLWMSPDELLVMCPYPEAAQTVSALTEALSGQHHLAADVSDARALFTLSGEPAQIREVLAKVTPADMRPASLPVQELRRTRLAQVPAALWFSDETTANVICFRSVARYTFDVLKAAADPLSDVAHL